MKLAVMQLHKAPLKTPINAIKINETQNWRGTILSQIEVYKKIAPNYKKVKDFLQESLSYKTDSLTAINVHMIKCTCDYLNIKYDIEILSEMELNIQENLEPDEWGLEIAIAIGADKYINSPGGILFFDETKYFNLAYL